MKTEDTAKMNHDPEENTCALKILYMTQFQTTIGQVVSLEKRAVREEAVLGMALGASGLALRSRCT